jgi:hypothetical protein
MGSLNFFIFLQSYKLIQELKGHHKDAIRCMIPLGKDFMWTGSTEQDASICVWRMVTPGHSYLPGAVNVLPSTHRNTLY